jgi:uncharacterized membrane protein HdeD (DUF308 family)
MLALTGVVIILFGIAALIWPGLTLATFIFLFGAQAIINGIAELVATFRAISDRRTWWTHLVLGIVNVAAGIVVFVYPGLTALVLLWVIAFWAIALGIVEVVGSFSTGQAMLLVTGLISIAVGFILLANPGTGALAYVFLIGVFAIVRGIVLLVAAFRETTPSPTA